MKNGQLWWNLDTDRVERVVGRLNKARVFTCSHNYSDFGPVKQNRLIKANDNQVEDYLKESEELKTKRTLEVNIKDKV